MARTTYSVTFGSKTYKRSSEHHYTHASWKRGEFGAVVKFHKSYDSAVRAAGSFGEVKPVCNAKSWY